MAKHMIRKGAALLAACLAASALSGCSISVTQKADNGSTEATQDTTEKADALTVVTTSYPVYDWTVQMTDGLENIDVLLATEDGVSSNASSVNTAYQIDDCDLLIYSELNSDTWALDYASQHPDVKTLHLASVEGIQLLPEDNSTVLSKTSEESTDGDIDQYYWLSIANAKTSCNAIAQELKALSPEQKDAIQNKADKYLQNLDALDAQYKAAVQDADKDKRTVVMAGGNHFQYLMKEYGLTCYYALAADEDASDMTDEIARQVIDKMDELGATVFLDERQDTYNGISGMVLSASAGTNHTAVSLNNMADVTTDSNLTYLSMAQQNLYLLQIALGTRTLQG